MTEQKLHNGLNVYTAGNRENKPVTFIHGFPLDASMWQKQIEFLQNDFFCIAYDVRGLGRSEVGDGQYTMELFADDLISVLDVLNIGRTVICGLSMGGYIALRALEKYPDRFSGLILCDTKAEADDNAAKIKRAGAVQKIREEGTEKYVAGFIPLTVHPASIERLGSDYAELITKLGKAEAKGLRGCQLAMLGRTDLNVFLASIRMPSLVICGEKDSLSPPEVMRNMADLINGSEFKLIPETGHLAPLERPEIVNPIMRKFLLSF